MSDTTTVTRQIVRIDRELCTGCGVCVSPCAEGAIVIVDGRARVVREELCDGAGFCLGVCPTGALTIEERATVPFDHEAVEEHAAASPRTYVPQVCFRCGADEDDVPLVPVRTEGTSTWVCTHCLPALIHG
jgi:MinD superfamily P-loop ATPase